MEPHGQAVVASFAGEKRRLTTQITTEDQHSFQPSKTWAEAVKDLPASLDCEVFLLEVSTSSEWDALQVRNSVHSLWVKSIACITTRTQMGLGIACWRAGWRRSAVGADAKLENDVPECS